jgi:hypothetical protein
MSLAECKAICAERGMKLGPRNFGEARRDAGIMSDRDLALTNGTIKGTKPRKHNLDLVDPDPVAVTSEFLIDVQDAINLLQEMKAENARLREIVRSVHESTKLDQKES